MLYIKFYLNVLWDSTKYLSLGQIFDLRKKTVMCVTRCNIHKTICSALILLSV